MTVDSTSTLETQTEPLSPTVAFELLAPPRRRIALEYLSERGTSVAVDELAAHIVSSNDPRTGTCTEKVLVSLCHTDLPKLVDADCIAYDPERGVIELQEPIDQLVPYLDIAASQETHEAVSTHHEDH